ATGVLQAEIQRSFGTYCVNRAAPPQICQILGEQNESAAQTLLPSFCHTYPQILHNSNTLFLFCSYLIEANGRNPTRNFRQIGRITSLSGLKNQKHPTKTGRVV
ncbi:MAG: hypothetical protein ACI9VX_002511, partial [Dinoroseobacter sp.]